MFRRRNGCISINVHVGKIAIRTHVTFSGVGSAQANVDGPGALGEEVVGRGSSLDASGAAASFSCRFLARFSSLICF